MATRKKRSSSSVRAAARDVVSGGERIREGVRDLVVSSAEGVTASTDAIGRIVHEVMEGSASAIRDAMPKDRDSPLREVISGLTEAATVLAESGRKSASHAMKSSRKVITGSGTTLRDSALRATHDVLAAVESFASTAAGATRKEVERLVAEARTTGGRLAAPTRRASGAASRHPATFAKETVETTARFALGTTSRLMTAAGGMLSGLGKDLASAGKAGAAARSTTGRKTTAKSSTKATKKKSAKSSGASASGGTARQASTKSGRSGTTKKTATKAGVRRSAKG